MTFRPKWAKCQVFRKTIDITWRFQLDIETDSGNARSSNATNQLRRVDPNQMENEIRVNDDVLSRFVAERQ